MSKKLDSIEKLENKLDQEISWRKKELEILRLKCKDENLSFLDKKAIVLLLYADWEGFVKYAANCYVRYVFSQVSVKQDRPLAIFKTGFWELAVQDSLHKLINSKSEKQAVNKELFDKLSERFNEKNIPTNKKEYIYTQNNLDHKAFNEIIRVIGLNESDFTISGQHPEDLLVKSRNVYAHGERRNDEINIEILEDRILYILDLMERFKLKIIEAADKELYLIKTVKDDD